MLSLIAILLSTPFTAIGQQPTVPNFENKWQWVEEIQSSIPPHEFKGYALTANGSIEKACLAFIKQYFDEFNDPRAGLRLYVERHSLVGTHLTFCQTFEGYRIHGTEIKFNLREGRKISSLFYTTLNTINWPSAKFEAPIDVPDNSEKIIFFDGEEASPAWLSENLNYEENTFLNVIHFPDGGVISRSISRDRKEPRDSMVYAYVYNPDPLTAAGRTYGGDFQNFNDGDNDSLTKARKLVTVKMRYLADSFWAENESVKLISNNLNFVVPNSRTDTFNYTRSQDEFEYINALYHITQYRNYIQSLGFDTLMNYQISVNARAFLDDNSNFIRTNNSDGKGTLRFGYSASSYEHVDDAEDADVVIHEYGHAISYHANENSLDGGAREAIDEGLGDYLACAYSQRISSYRSEYLFSWDGHNPFWEEGRRCFTDKTAEDYGANDSKYENGEIFAGMLMDVNDALGNEVTDRILFLSLYEYADRMSFENAGVLLLDAEQDLYQGIYHDTLCSILQAYKFVNEGCPSGIGEDPKIKTGYFIDKTAFKTNGTISVDFHGPFTGHVSLYDMGGKLIYSAPANEIERFEKQMPCSPGVYLLKIDDGWSQTTEKMIR